MQQHKLCINKKMIIFIQGIHILNFWASFFYIDCTLFIISVELRVSLGDYFFPQKMEELLKR